MNMPNEALEYLTSDSVKKGPDTFNRLRAQAYLDTEQYKLALKECAEISQDERGVWVFLIQGKACSALNRYTDALHCFNKAVSLSHLSCPAFYIDENEYATLLIYFLKIEFLF